MRKNGFDLRKFDKFRKIVSRSCGSGVSPEGPFKRMFKQWGVRYLAWTKRRFVKNSAGGGEWPALKPSTIAGRRAGRAKVRSHSRRKRGTHVESYYRRSSRKISILRDTGILFKALTIGAAGNLFKFIRGGIRVGFGGPAKHPDGKATIRDIAVFHDQGKGDLPKRQILYEPDAELKRGMLEDMKRAVETTGRSL